MRRDSLWFHRDFRMLWAGDTVGQFGTYTGHALLPMLAVTVLAASPMEMGVLTAAEFVAFLALGLPAGVWVDRMRRRPLLLGGALARGVLLLSVPLAGWLGMLTITHVIVVALLVGTCTLFFDVAYQSYLPALVGRARLVEGNAKLQASQSAAQIAGPGLGGGLAQLAGSVSALAATGGSHLVSALLLGRIRAHEPRPTRSRSTTLRADITEGLRFVFGNPNLRAITLGATTGSLANTAYNAVGMLFLIRTVGMSPAEVGLTLAAGGTGGVLGALSAGWWTRRIGQARSIWLVPLFTWPALLLVPLAAPGWRAMLVPIALAIVGYGIIVFNVAQVSYRQAICPDHLLGRMNATVRFVMWGAMPIGGLLGGLLGEWIGVHATVWVTTLAECAAAVVLACSPLRRVSSTVDPAAATPV